MKNFQATALRGGPGRLWLVLAGLLLATTFSGCGGCSCTTDPIKAQQEKARREAEARLKKLEEERKKREKPKPDFEFARFLTQPNDLDKVEAMFKPGHWTSATVEVIANNGDFQGELVTEPFDLDNMPYRLGTSRPVTLAKGQKKALELTIYVPPGKTNKSPKTTLQTRGGQELLFTQQPLLRMPDHQFYFIVLSRDPNRYAYYSDLDTVRPPSGEFLTGSRDFFYRLKLPKIESRTPLPTNPLCWTSIAYILWDDLHPDLLTPDQQQALLDWLHWGGQLIVSGPGTLEDLKSSFLEPYLPAVGGGALEITPGLLDEMNQTWTLKGPRLFPANAWTGQRLNLHPDSAVLVHSGDEPLVVERRLGRGRIVLSAFRLGQRELQDWKGFDGFLNGCLLRRGPRRFSESDQAEVQFDWTDDYVPVAQVPPPQPPQQPGLVMPFNAGMQSYGLDDPRRKARRLNPRRVSTVGYFTRDTYVSNDELDKNYRLQQMAAEMQNQPEIDAVEAVRMARLALSTLRGDEEPESIGSGVAGWSDGNAAAQLARSSLTGGIVIPDAKFVLWVLGTYLTVLVPLNWAVFRLIGRVEWAWIAAPLITIGFAVAVVKLAQLDVGFVRTQSEVGIVELHGGYSRAHVTRYTALYSSLSTTYDLRFADPTALVQPFPAQGKMIKQQTLTTVNFRRDQGGPTKETEKFPIALQGFDVSSNSQAMLHSEHMLDLKGTLRLKPLPSGGLQVVNDTHLRLQGAGVIGPQGVAWVGTLEPGAAAVLKFEPLAEIETPAESQDESHDHGPGDHRPKMIKTIEEPWLSERDQSPLTAGRFPAEVLNVRQIVRLAQNTVRPGEVRLVAWIDEELPGMRVEPAASQVRHTNVVIAHLKPPREPGPLPDANTHLEIKAADFEEKPEPEEKFE